MSLTKFSLNMAFAMLFAVAAVAQGDEKAAPKPTDLEGKAAPAIKLDLVGGGELDLAAHRGKEYVVLDLWTTWCPHCVKATEHFEAAQETWKGKDVAFYMVSIGEEEETVKDFVEKKKVKSKIALDPELTMVKDYYADKIPHLVIIDKEGKVVKVKIGEDKIADAMEETLTEALGAPDA